MKSEDSTPRWRGFPVVMIIKALRRRPKFPGTIIFLLLVTGLFSYKLVIGMFHPEEPMSVNLSCIVGGAGCLLIVPFMGAALSTVGFVLLCLATILYGIFPTFSGGPRVALAASSSILLVATIFVFALVWVHQRQRKRQT